MTEELFSGSQQRAEQLVGLFWSIFENHHPLVGAIRERSAIVDSTKVNKCYSLLRCFQTGEPKQWTGPSYINHKQYKLGTTHQLCKYCSTLSRHAAVHCPLELFATWVDVAVHLKLCIEVEDFFLLRNKMGLLAQSMKHGIK